jgi:hypothetical protein
LLLADCASVWNSRRENRHLPSLLQCYQIEWLTQKKNWTPTERKMMRKAKTLHILWVTGFVMLAMAFPMIPNYVGYRAGRSAMVYLDRTGHLDFSSVAEYLVWALGFCIIVPILAFIIGRWFHKWKDKS